MMLFYTRSVKHFVEKLTLPKANFLIKNFSDGEIYVKINEEKLETQEVWIIASTQPPAENIIELFLLLDALMKRGAKKINIFFAYFGYARQSISMVGEAASAQLISNFLKMFNLNKIVIMHAHAAQTLQTFLPFTNVIDVNFFCTVAQHYDCIAAPDKGAVDFANVIAQKCKKEIVYLHKIRPEHEKVSIASIDGIATGKKILLVDDIIATGNTIIEAAIALKKIGAQEVSAAATHGIFSAHAYERLEKSSLKKIYVTNTLNPPAKGNIEVFDVSNFIESILLR